MLLPTELLEPLSRGAVDKLLNLPNCASYLVPTLRFKGGEGIMEF